jgi:hypothetical protein
LGLLEIQVLLELTVSMVQQVLLERTVSMVQLGLRVQQGLLELTVPMELLGLLDKGYQLVEQLGKY